MLPGSIKFFAIDSTLVVVEVLSKRPQGSPKFFTDAIVQYHCVNVHVNVCVRVSDSMYMWERCGGSHKSGKQQQVLKTHEVRLLTLYDSMEGVLEVASWSVEPEASNRRFASTCAWRSLPPAMKAVTLPGATYTCTDAEDDTDLAVAVTVMVYVLPTIRVRAGTENRAGSKLAEVMLVRSLPIRTDQAYSTVLIDGTQ